MITIDKSQIDAIKRVCKAASTKNPIQYFENILLEANENSLKMTAGDGIVEISASIKVDVKSGFSICVNAAKFSQSVDACKGGSITVKDLMTVKNGRRSFKLQTLPSENYPSYQDAINEDKIDIKPIEIIDAIKSVSFAASKNDVRSFLNGVFIGEDAVATNGHRMSVFPIGLKSSAIVSIEAVNKIPLEATGDVFLSSNVLSIIDSDFSFKCKLIDGRYPDYKKVIPTKFKHSINIDSAHLKDAIKAAQINAPDSGNILLIFGAESSIKSASGKKEEALIGLDCESDSEFEMAFNSSYLIDVMNSVTSESITINFSESQAIIEDGGQINVISMCRV